jgi:hypothetical protein
VVILLWPGADGPAMNGNYRAWARGGEQERPFTYQVQRVWERKPEETLAAGLGTLPMAPLSKVAPERLPDVIRRMRARIDAEATREQAANIWVTTCFWMGLRFPDAQVRALLRDVWSLMSESQFYQGTLAAGYADGLWAHRTA